MTTSDIRNLNSDIRRLRNEENALITGSDKLLAWGITSHATEVTNRLHAIHAEADAIADRLDNLGATRAAYEARDGWALILPPPTPPEANA